MIEEKLINKTIRIHLSNGYHYTGQVVKEDETHIKIIDKFKNPIQIQKDAILTCEVLP